MAFHTLESVFTPFAGEPREIIPLLQAVRRQEGHLPEDETSDDCEYTLETVACIGACASRKLTDALQTEIDERGLDDAEIKRTG